MLWKGRRQSDNVEDRRSLTTTGVAVGGGGTLLLLLVGLIFGVDPRQLLDQLQGPEGAAPAIQDRGNPRSANDEGKEFVAVVLADTEDVWNTLFKRMGKSYREPKLVLFNGEVRSACGFASAAVGPFYCPGDETVYIDLEFFEEMRTRFKVPGDFARAYVIAHEVGHHVQKLLGTSARVDAQRGRLSKAEFNKLSVRLELQADFYAGVWAHHAQKMKKILESGDIDEALAAANAIGDDALQKQARGYVVPDSFTHGTSQQRSRWFRRGLQTGDVNQGDTFSASDL